MAKQPKKAAKKAKASRKKKRVLPPKKENYTYKQTFSEKEIREKSRQLAEACQERGHIEDEKKAVMSDYKSKLDSKEAEINTLAGDIQRGFNMKTNLCEVKKDFSKGVKHYLFDGKRVGTEKLTAKDHQAELDEAEAHNKKEAYKPELKLVKDESKSTEEKD